MAQEEVGKARLLYMGRRATQGGGSIAPSFLHKRRRSKDAFVQFLHIRDFIEFFFLAHSFPYICLFWALSPVPRARMRAYIMRLLRYKKTTV